MWEDIKLGNSPESRHHSDKDRLRAICNIEQVFKKKLIKKPNLRPPTAAAAATPAATAPRAGVEEGAALHRGKSCETSQGTILKDMTHTRTARWPRREQRLYRLGLQTRAGRSQGDSSWRHGRSFWP